MREQDFYPLNLPVSLAALSERNMKQLNRQVVPATSPYVFLAEPTSEMF